MAFRVIAIIDKPIDWSRRRAYLERKGDNWQVKSVLLNNVKPLPREKRKRVECFPKIRVRAGFFPVINREGKILEVKRGTKRKNSNN